jgi:hypothetical protein
MRFGRIAAPSPRPRSVFGFAADSDRGVITAVIHGMERRSLAETSLGRVRLRDPAVNHGLQLRDLEGGTFTLSNLGMYPVDFFAPIVNHPQCAILATGRVRQVAAVGAGGIVPVWKMWANVALDDRVADGAVGAQFVAELERLIESLPAHGCWILTTLARAPSGASNRERLFSFEVDAGFSHQELGVDVHLCKSKTSRRFL